MDLVFLVEQKLPIGKEKLASFVGGYLGGRVSREEMTAFLRAVCKHGLCDEDAVLLTEVMLESGERLQFKPRAYPYADKHSTGGVADSTTLVIAPIVAAAGVPFLKMSGRKLGHTGGTIDKLECFRGLKTEISVQEAERLVDKTGAAIIAQSKELVPADKALYKLRDETGTVKSLPLIASSVVSKKLASGAEVLVLDVKTGKGAFMESVEEGEKLARLMVKILKDSGRKAAAVLSDMNSPLGEGVGGVLEVLDAIEVLEGKESRLSQLSRLIAGKILSLAKNLTEEEGVREAGKILESGKALAKLTEIIAAQGGSLNLFSPEKRKEILEENAGEIIAEKCGYIRQIDCVKLGNLAREFEENGGYGMRVYPKVGSRVEVGVPLVTLYGKKSASPAMLDRLHSCFDCCLEPVKENPLVYRIVT